MADVQVTCINKQPRNNPHEGITHLGNLTGKWTRQQVIDWIEAKANTFFTVVKGKRADIGVVNGANGKYLTAALKPPHGARDILISFGVKMLFFSAPTAEADTGGDHQHLHPSTICGTSAKFHKCTDRDQPPTAQSILVAAIASLSNDPNVFTDVCLCHVGVERQNLGLEFSNQPLERGDFCFQRLDALLQFCVGSAPWFERASDLERDADLV